MWSKFSDDYYRNKKVVRAGRDARDLHTASVLHSNEDLTDGFVDRSFLRQLIAAADITDGDSAVSALEREQLWHPCDGGWVIHDFHDYNPTREQVLYERMHIHEVRSQAGKKGAEARWGGKTDSKTDFCQWQNDGNEMAPVPGSRFPVPVPASRDPEEGEERPPRAPRVAAFKPPCLADVTAFFVEIGSMAVVGEDFFDHFTGNGWKVGGKSPMVDWHACARRWKRQQEKFDAERISTKRNGAYPPKPTTSNAEFVDSLVRDGLITGG